MKTDDDEIGGLSTVFNVKTGKKLIEFLFSYKFKRFINIIAIFGNEKFSLKI